jgi:hypothetical protein
MESFLPSQQCLAWGLASDPPTAPSDRVTLCTYHAWFATDLPLHGEHWRKAAPCITAPNVSYSHLTSYIKLRTSNHKLAINGYARWCRVRSEDYMHRCVDSSARFKMNATLQCVPPLPTPCISSPSGYTPAIL